jgi:hypothetical protein
MSEHVCFKKECSSTDVVIRVDWSSGWKSCRMPVNWYCEEHAQRIRDRRDKAFTCSCYPGRDHATRVVRITEIPSYDRARQAWLDTGFLADKDKMLATITLTEPASWDTYGSIMADPPPAPVAVRQHRVSGPMIAALTIFTVLFIAAFILGGLLL